MSTRLVPYRYRHKVQNSLTSCVLYGKKQNFHFLKSLFSELHLFTHHFCSRKIPSFRLAEDQLRLFKAQNLFIQKYQRKILFFVFQDLIKEFLSPLVANNTINYPLR